MGAPEEGRSLERLAPNGRKEIKGPLFEMVEEAWGFYRKRAGKVSRIEGLIRRDNEPEFPEKVMREALLNAVVHRRYDDAARGTHVILELFRDRTMIGSPGAPVSPNSAEGLNRGEAKSIRRNEGLAKAAAEMGMMERRGKGIEMMRNNLDCCGLRPPTFEYGEPYLFLTLWGMEKSLPSWLVPETLRAQLPSRHLWLLDLIRERARIASKEYTKEYRVAFPRREKEPESITRETANQDFRHLIELGLIERRGTGRATYYVLSSFFAPRPSNG